jgi:diaminopimelate epimerase
MELRFFKYQGTGNDFILIDNRDGSVHLDQKQIAALCHRRFGIGADGLMLLQNEPGVDFKMVYFNSDGRESSMCGNGGRCIVAFASRLGIVGNKARFTAVDGVHEALIDASDNIALKMQDVKNIEQSGDHFILNTGSPHYVRVVHALNDLDVVAEGKIVRYGPEFAEDGINVNFLERVGEELFVRTYERGVEDETYSCGTGVTASALVACLRGMATTKNSCVVKTMGGVLEVSYERVLENNFYNIWLKGPASFVFEGAIAT